ncbi:MAG: P-loop NTPase fold protein [Succinatimonas sp.]|nr:P-loop NTPase fold protein [Succinatimonas sp.]
MSNTIQDLDKYSNIVDIPLSGEQQDLLGVDRYVNALARFIQRAKTPSTLSIQGEWGSGKTSLMNQIHQKLCKQDANDSNPYRGIWLNIWKLSLMHTPEQTLAQVINEITKQILEILENEYGGYKDDKSDFWNQVDFKKVGKSALKALFKGAVNLGATYVGAGPIVNAENSSESKEKTITSIPDLQNSMEAVIQYCWKKDREKNPNAKGFLFFIDDLDRLDPTVAVSVLELLKNVFEVEHCVFILAIDYEVVVRGLIPKFGEFNDKTERQFRSFFDKIIQLPFNMPVQSYDTKSYVTNALNNIDYFTSEELDQLTNIVEDDYEFSQYLDEDDMKQQRSQKMII